MRKLSSLARAALGLLLPLAVAAAPEGAGAPEQVPASGSPSQAGSGTG